jgi:hypothetical protein
MVVIFKDMKCLFTAIAFLLLMLGANAQNLVANGNFEAITTCPTSFSMIANAPPWYMYTSGSSDLFNGCASGSAGVPVNFTGYQLAASGIGYAGGYSFTSLTNNTAYTEYIAAPITAMSIGSVYEVSMSVNLSNVSGYGNNGLGAWFFRYAATSVSGSSTLTVTPQVNYASYGVITDTTNWVRLTAYFTADSAYDHIVIGKFTPAAGLLTTQTSTGSYSYYYFDSVVVKLAYGINNLYTDSMICAGDVFQVPYSLNNPSIYTSGNVFTAQLSNSSGTFTSGVTTIGTRTATTAGSITCNVPVTATPGSNYRIRIISSSAVDSSNPNQYPISVGVVHVNKPVAANNGPLCTTSTLNLSANSTTSGVNYTWSGPASFTSAVQNPSIASVTTANSGAYIVTARLFGCIAKDTTTVSVSSVSATSIVCNANTPLCERDTLKLTATVSIIPNSYSWTGPNGFHSSARDTNISNAMPLMSGDYIIAANYTGCTTKDTVTVDVKPLAANRTLGSNSPVCTGNTLNLNAGSSSTGVGYTWTGPNSYVTSTQNPSISSITTAAAGRYVIAYFLNGCTVKDSFNVTINTSPIAITATSNAPICEPDTLRLFSSNSTSGASYSWSGPGSYNSAVQNPKRGLTAPSMSGYYVVTASLSNGCITKDSVLANVKPLPANFGASNNGPVCTGATLQLGASSTSSGVTWNWTGPNGFSSTSQTPIISSATTAATGSYILTGNLNGCTVVANTFATVNPLPATPSASANSPVCIGQDLKLNASTVAGVTYEWIGPSSYSSTLQNPIRNTATISMAGNYYVRALLSGCYSPNSSVTVNVVTAPNITLYPSPKDSICQGATLTLISTATNAGTNPTYKWYRNNSLVSGATVGTYSTTSAADLDEYFCSITSIGVCADPYTDSSVKIPIHVLPWLAPGVSINQTPTGTIASGKLITFNAFPVNGGVIPKYQWKRNNANVIGATSNTWGAYNLNDKDIICVEMTSTYMCPNPASAKSNCIEVSILNNGSSINGPDWKTNPPYVYPNPIWDKLIIEGIHKGVKMQMVDMLGRTVVNEVATNEKETINVLALVSGTYVLRLTSDDTLVFTVKIVKQ